jgi:predicted dehydrogenase
LNDALRIGVIGLGVISRFYVEALDGIGGLRLAAVCDRDDQALRPFRGIVPCHTDYRELLDPGELDAVVITLPNDLHAAACQAALAAGLAVCVEKPLALTLDEGRAIVDRARASRLVNFTAFHRRYNGAVLALIDRLAGRGPIESVRIRYWERIEDHVGRDRWYLDAARCGGGCVADNGPNAYDLVRLLLGELRVRDVEIARDAARLDRQATVTLAAANGVQAVVDLDWSYDGEVKDVLVRLADGSSDGADMLAGHEGFKASLRHEYVGVLAAFRDRIAANRAGANREPPATRFEPDDGLAALELVERTYHVEAQARGVRNAAAPQASGRRSGAQ